MQFQLESFMTALRNAYETTKAVNFIPVRQQVCVTLV